MWKTSGLAGRKGVRSGSSGGSLYAPRSWPIPGPLNPVAGNITRTERK